MLVHPTPPAQDRSRPMGEGGTRPESNTAVLAAASLLRDQYLHLANDVKLPDFDRAVYEKCFIAPLSTTAVSCPITKRDFRFQRSHLSLLSQLVEAVGLHLKSTMEVLQLCLRREAVLRDLNALCEAYDENPGAEAKPIEGRAGSRNTASGMSKAEMIEAFYEQLFTYQQTSLCIVESIVDWRTRLSRPFPFMYEETNYILKIQQESSRLASTSLARAATPHAAPCPLFSNSLKLKSMANSRSRTNMVGTADGWCGPPAKISPRSRSGTEKSPGRRASTPPHSKGSPAKKRSGGNGECSELSDETTNIPQVSFLDPRWTRRGFHSTQARPPQAPPKPGAQARNRGGRTRYSRVDELRERLLEMSPYWSSRVQPLPQVVFYSPSKLSYRVGAGSENSSRSTSHPPSNSLPGVGERRPWSANQQRTRKAFSDSGNGGYRGRSRANSDITSTAAGENSYPFVLHPYQDAVLSGGMSKANQELSRRIAQGEEAIRVEAGLQEKLRKELELLLKGDRIITLLSTPDILPRCGAGLPMDESEWEREVRHQPSNDVDSDNSDEEVDRVVPPPEAASVETKNLHLPKEGSTVSDSTHDLNDASSSPSSSSSSTSSTSSSPSSSSSSSSSPSAKSASTKPSSSAGASERSKSRDSGKGSPPQEEERAEKTSSATSTATTATTTSEKASSSSTSSSSSSSTTTTKSSTSSSGTGGSDEYSNSFDSSESDA